MHVSPTAYCLGYICYVTASFSDNGMYLESIVNAMEGGGTEGGGGNHFGYF